MSELDPPAEPSQPGPAEPAAEAPAPSQPGPVEAPAPRQPGSAAEAPPPRQPGPRPYPGGAGKTIALIGATVALVTALVLFLPRRVDLIVDNGTGDRLRVFLDDVDQGVLEPEETRTLSSILAGKVRLLARVEGPAGERGADLAQTEAELTAPLFRRQRRAYVWNVARKTPSYWIVTRAYGDRAQEVFRPEAYEPPDEVFAIPERCVPLLNDFPEQIRVPPGHKGGTREALFSDHRVRRLESEQRFKEQFERLKPLIPGQQGR